MPPGITPSNSTPTRVSALPNGGTIATSGTFQTALQDNPARRGGFIQNNSSAVLYVFAGQSGATRGSSIQVPPGICFNLNMGTHGFIYIGAVMLDGATGAAFATMELTS